MFGSRENCLPAMVLWFDLFKGRVLISSPFSFFSLSHQPTVPSLSSLSVTFPFSLHIKCMFGIVITCNLKKIIL
jgi:hypothetical protein